MKFGISQKLKELRIILIIFLVEFRVMKRIFFMLSLALAALIFSCSEDSNTNNPTIKPNISSINPSTAAVGEIISITGTNFGTTRGTNIVSFADINAIDYTSWTDTEIKLKVPGGAISGKVWLVVNGEKSNELSFTVKSIINDNYETVTIGTQVWMKKNLDLSRYRNGDTIPQVTDPTQWGNLTTGAWCYYYKDPSNGAIYGKLYNWYAVNDPRGLAPEGWHVASDAEWTTLSNYLGEFAGGKIKETGTAHWHSPNTGATNESGFSALPGGYRYEYGGYEDITYWGLWWSSTENNTTAAWGRTLGYATTTIYRKNINKVYGLSVRCVKD